MKKVDTEDLKKAIAFYNASPTGQWDDLAAIALTQWLDKELTQRAAREAIANEAMK